MNDYVCMYVSTESLVCKLIFKKQITFLTLIDFVVSF